MDNKVPIPDEYFIEDPIICEKCGKMFNTVNEWLKSDCWYLDHEALED